MEAICKNSLVIYANKSNQCQPLKNFEEKRDPFLRKKPHAFLDAKNRKIRP